MARVMENRAFRMNLTAPLHVGEMGIGQEGTLAHVPSDTLFSALAVTWRELPNHAQRTLQMAEHFGPAPSLLLSSAMPFVGDTLLLPKPNLPLIPQARHAADHGVAGSPKDYKRVRWISEKVFRALVVQPTQQQLDALWVESKLLQGNSVWLSPDEFGDLPGDLQREGQIWDTQRVPKVTVDRVRNAGTLFHVGRVHFAEGCGLWCLAQGEAEWLDAVETGLHMLGDSGMGGQRSKGNGQFVLETITPPELNVTNGEAHTYHVLLGRCAPTLEQMDRLQARHAAYQLSTVGGFNGTPGDGPLIRKQMRMLSEGSIIRAGETPSGNLVDVTPDSPAVRPDHRIYRYGFGLGAAIALPAETNEEKNA